MGASESKSASNSKSCAMPACCYTLAVANGSLTLDSAWSPEHSQLHNVDDMNEERHDFRVGIKSLHMAAYYDYRNVAGLLRQHGNQTKQS